MREEPVKCLWDVRQCLFRYQPITSQQINTDQSELFPDHQQSDIHIPETFSDKVWQWIQNEWTDAPLPPNGRKRPTERHQHWLLRMGVFTYAGSVGGRDLQSAAWCNVTGMALKVKGRSPTPHDCHTVGRQLREVDGKHERPHLRACSVGWGECYEETAPPKMHQSAEEPSKCRKNNVWVNYLTQFRLFFFFKDKGSSSHFVVFVSISNAEKLPAQYWKLGTFSPTCLLDWITLLWFMSVSANLKCFPECRGSPPTMAMACLLCHCLGGWLIQKTQASLVSSHWCFKSLFFF